MSGFLKGIGKVFKSVFKVVKKVLPYALAIGAVVLTGGAALGVLPAMSTMMAGAVGGLGLSAGVMGALTSAVTMAGYGGLAGLITGGPKGLLKGALYGGLAGGAGSALGLLHSTGAAGIGFGGGGGGLLGGAPGVAGGGVPGAVVESGAGTNWLTHNVMAGAAGGGGAGGAGGAVGGGGVAGLLGQGGLGNLIGPALQGLGGGVGQGAQYKAEKKAAEARQKQLEANYSLTGGPLDPNGLMGPYQASGSDLAVPSLDPYSLANKWVYDPQMQRMVRREGV